MTTPELVEHMLYESEGVALDFKREQYAFVGASVEQKVELLKDVLAFVNSWRRTDAYILIGVGEVKGGRADVLGISDHIDDASLQQFINAKTQRPVNLAYTAVSVDGKQVAVIHIPVQERPVYLKQNFGRLKANAVYIRRGSSTEEAAPDEVARMGRMEDTGDALALDVFVADPHARQRVDPHPRSLLLDIPAAKEIPDYAKRVERSIFSTPLDRTRRGYYRELATFTKKSRFLSPLHFAIANSGTATVRDVRIEIWVPGADREILIVAADDYPHAPQMEDPMFPNFQLHNNQRAPDWAVSTVDQHWVVSGRADKVQPKATVWFADAVYIGSSVETTVDISVKVYADNLQSPHEQSIPIPVEVTFEKVDLKRILELEHERVVNSPSYRRFLRERGWDEELTE